MESPAQLASNSEQAQRILKDQNSSCKLCTDAMDDLPHLFSCRYSTDVCQALLRTVTSVMPSATPQKILLLSLDIEPDLELPVVWIVSSTLLYVWSHKKSKKQCTLVETRAVLEARVNMLRRGEKLQEASTLIDRLVTNFF